MPRRCSTASPRTDAEHFAQVRALLEDAGQAYDLDPTLVRGLDYYTRTVFEFTSDALGAQSGVGGGGRYDGLMELIGGRPTPASGWAAGVERMLLSAGELPVAPDFVDLFVALADPSRGRAAFELTNDARQAGLRAQMELAGRSLKGQLKHADRLSARYVAIIGGDDERQVSFKDMESGEQTRDRGPARDPHDPAGQPPVSFPMVNPPRPNRYRDAWAGQLDADPRRGGGPRLSGWVHRRRDHGGLIFIDLRERSGIVQLVFHPETAAEAHAAAHALRSEDVIAVSGSVTRRAPENVNPNLATGEVEIAVAGLEILADADTPPFPLDEDTAVNEDLRLRHRSLDLRRPPMQEALALRHQVVRTMREVLDARDFLEIETPFLTRSTPEGARDFLVPARMAPGSFYALPQSPQLFKQLLMVGGFERYYQIVRCFRDEDARADRLPEFTQLDIEMGFVEEDDVLELSEAVMGAVFERAGFALPATPWPRMTHAEAMSRFGSDRPDTRFGLELHDLADAVGQQRVQGLLGRRRLRRRRARPQRRGRTP